jgi:predicted DCC family thiol-disulfide oxidoreductase YuxK
MTIKTQNKPTITCYHDGDCPICRIEINAMKKLDKTSQQVKWVDISTNKQALKEAGLSYEQAMSMMHVQDAQGMKSGVDSFLVLWSHLPYYRRLVPVIEHVPLLKPLVAFGYQLFAKYRLKLTGKSAQFNNEQSQP